MEILGIDIGGSGIKAAVVDVVKGEMVTERNRIETPQPAKPEPMMKVIRELIDSFSWKGPIGCGYPGVIIGQEVRSAANLHKSWLGENLGSKIKAETGCDAWVLNDADAAGIAEYHFGAAKGRDGVVMLITVGTGLGTAIFVNGQLYPNTELGHIIMDGKEAEKVAAGSIRKKEDLSFKEWAKRFDAYMKYIHELMYPDLFIIGGGIAKKSEKFMEYFTVGAEVVPAELLNEAGIVGAAKAGEIYLK